MFCNIFWPITALMAALCSSEHFPAREWVPLKQRWYRLSFRFHFSFRQELDPFRECFVCRLISRWNIVFPFKGLLKRGKNQLSNCKIEHNVICEAFEQKVSASLNVTTYQLEVFSSLSLSFSVGVGTFLASDPNPIVCHSLWREEETETVH